MTFGDIVMLSEEDRGGAGAAMQHERLGEHAPGRKQEADISLTPQRSIGDRGGIRARSHSSL